MFVAYCIQMQGVVAKRYKQRSEYHFIFFQISFSEEPFLQEQRLLWIHFLMDPKKLVALVRQLQELTEKRINDNKLKYQKKKGRQSRFFPQGLQK
jgi:23S rRNA A1618 N6-methylase RlmF